MKKILVGCDPEVFFQNMNGVPMSIIGKLGGTKDQALLITKHGHGVLEDNCAAEFNIPPAATPKDFQKSIDICIDFLKRRAVELQATLSPFASVEMPMTDLQNPAAWVFGCEPDYNAYTGEKNPKPSCDNPTLRSAGGHVHIGFKKDASKEEQENVIRWCDLLMGVPSVLKDKDTLRRKLYGRPGAYRPKPAYGVEYRTLSNYWIFDKKETEWVFETAQKAVEMSERIFLPADDAICHHVQDAINNSDAALAMKTMEYAHVYLGV